MYSEYIHEYYSKCFNHYYVKLLISVHIFKYFFTVGFHLTINIKNEMRTSDKLQIISTYTISTATLSFTIIYIAFIINIFLICCIVLPDELIKYGSFDISFRRHFYETSLQIPTTKHSNLIVFFSYFKLFLFKELLHLRSFVHSWECDSNWF